MKIVTIEAWGLHLGYLGCYGSDWVATPNLDRLAAEGITFDWHIASQPTLQPGATTPLPSGMTVVRIESVAHFAGQALAAIEQNGGSLWIEGPSLLPPWHFDDDLLCSYFDEDDDAEGLEPWRDPPFDLVKLSEAETLELQNTYAAVVTAFDAQLGSLFDALRTRNLLDNMLLCVTARSGLPLSEHDMIGTPRPALHDELVHIPLVMRMPGSADAGLRIAALTQPADLLATFRSCCKTVGQAFQPDVIAVPVRLESLTYVGLDQSLGQNLWPLIRGEIEAIRPYAVASIRIGERECRLLRSLAWAFHLPMDDSATAQLFVKPDDRWEVNNVIQHHGEEAEAMARALTAQS